MRLLIRLLIDWPERLSAHFNWLPPLVARIVVGWVFVWSGWGKLNDIPTVVENFVGWGIPLAHLLAPFVSVVEFVGGLLLLLGLFTRLAAVPLIVVMVVAILTAKWSEVDSLETLLGFDEVAYLAIFLWLAVAGPGSISLNSALQLKFQSRPKFPDPRENTGNLVDFGR